MITGKQLVDFAMSKLGVPYVYGMKGAVMTREKYDNLKAMYGSYVWDSDVNKVGKVCCDCSGLISWCTGVVENSTSMYNNSIKRERISNIDNIPFSAILWQKGHVGIYIGGGKYVAEDGSAYGCRVNDVRKSGFTHWLYLPYIDHEMREKEDDEVVREIKIKLNGEVRYVNSINKDGNEYVRLRDLESPKIEIGFEKGQGPTVNVK